MCEMVVGQGVQVGDTKQMSNRTMQKEELIIPKKEGKKNFFEHLCAQPRAKCSHCKGREPWGAPSPGAMERESERMGQRQQVQEDMPGRGRGHWEEEAGWAGERGSAHSGDGAGRAPQLPGTSWSLSYKAGRGLGGAARLSPGLQGTARRAHQRFTDSS